MQTTCAVHTAICDKIWFFAIFVNDIASSWTVVKQLNAAGNRNYTKEREPLTKLRDSHNVCSGKSSSHPSAQMGPSAKRKFILGFISN
ncbi:hypothetical protein KIN20_015420 [Parelaphostrongylus tenuis]|uniref:Uncharacterized protein n=1 Tax=Parelaphostrongylus tenuis TaxID=148309 RepID=A0AAD5QSG1_PARTN|nr:hypothetical protein KIN20_015420 [Parelaphostrongylus tenuis]